MHEAFGSAFAIMIGNADSCKGGSDSTETDTTFDKLPMGDRRWGKSYPTETSHDVVHIEDPFNVGHWSAHGVQARSECPWGPSSVGKSPRRRLENYTQHR